LYCKLSAEGNLLAGTSIALVLDGRHRCGGNQMGSRHDEPHKRKEKPRAPSTGQGAASAMDALIKGRVPPPSQQGQPPEPPPKKH